MATITGFQQDVEGAYVLKDPNAELTYTVDWSDWLPGASTISTSSWSLETITGDTAPLVNEAATNANTTASITISGGAVNKVYSVYNTITTSGGLVDRRYFRIKVRARSL
jgi:hypothetical protein